MPRQYYLNAKPVGHLVVLASSDACTDQHDCKGGCALPCPALPLVHPRLYRLSFRLSFRLSVLFCSCLDQHTRACVRSCGRTGVVYAYVAFGNNRHRAAIADPPPYSSFWISSTFARKVHKSINGGASWPSSISVYGGGAAYSCMSPMPPAHSSTVGLLFERGDDALCTSGSSCRIVFAAVPADF